MALKHRFKLIFTEETVTDEGYVVKENPPIMGQIMETEEMFQNMLIPPVTISEMMLQKLCDGLKAELHNPNHYLKNKKENEVKIEEPDMEQTIIPMYHKNKN